MISIRPLAEVTDEDLVSINALLQQLRSDPTSHVPVSSERVSTVLRAPNTAVLVVRDENKIIGTGTIMWNTILTNTFAFIEDVVVDESYRGQGLGEKLTLELISVAKAQGVQTIGLTSRPTRIAANKLYQKLGFEQKETNVYRMKL